MRLTEFLSANREGILQNFETFAHTHTEAGRSMDVAALRDHSAELLKGIASDLEAPQSARARDRKSKGDAPAISTRLSRAAEKHGADRAADDFSLSETVSEFRALRASVLRLWMASGEIEMDEEDFMDLVRFDEAIDQMLAESADRYSTELARLQQERTREQERVTEKVRQAKSDFLQIVSHELRTPLHAISGYNALLEMGVYGAVPDAQRTILERMRFAEKHLLGIIEGILDLQRSSDETPLEVHEMPVAEAVDGLSTLVAPIAEKHGVDFTLDVEGGDGSVWANSAKLRQVLLNLITNALECTPRGGRVWVDHVDTAEGACFRVHDTGPGIPDDKLEAIFEPFVQLDMSLTRERGGIGLGLAISQQLARRMGGRITATSEVGKGSTFTVVLRNELTYRENAPPEGGADPVPLSHNSGPART